MAGKSSQSRREIAIEHVSGIGHGLVLVLLLLVLVQLCSLFLNESAIMLLLIDVVGVLSLSVFMGNSGIFNFGAPAFVALGAYAGSWITMGRTQAEIILPELPKFLTAIQVGVFTACLIVAVVGGLVALVLSIPLVRLSALGAAIASIGVLVIARDVILGAYSYTHGAETFYGTPIDLKRWQAFVVAALCVVFARWYKSSKSGLMLRASRDDPDAAAAIGVSVATARAISYAFAGALGAVTGVLYAHDIGAFGPSDFYFTMAFTLVAMLIAGGRMTVSGAIVGAVTITVLTQFLHSVEGGIDVFGLHVTGPLGLTQVALSASLLLFMYWRPAGLLGVREIDDTLVLLVRRASRGRHTGRIAEAPGSPKGQKS